MRRAAYLRFSRSCTKADGGAGAWASTHSLAASIRMSYCSHESVGRSQIERATGRGGLYLVRQQGQVFAVEAYLILSANESPAARIYLPAVAVVVVADTAER